MKFVTSWIQRPGQTVKDGQDSLKVFAKWAPDPSITWHQFVERVDGRGGYAVIETDNPAAMLRDAMTFAPWFEFSCEPVVDMLDASPVFTETVENIVSLIG